MDYRKHYDSLMKKARERDWRLLPYFERHHIVPRSEGGGNEDTNLIKLTAREHFLAHWFLYREDPSIKSRVFSFWRMCNGRGSTPPEHWLTISSRCYEEARKAHSEAISKALKGKKKTPEHVKKVADKIRGLKRTEEQKAKLRKPHKYSEEGLYRKRASMIGKTPRNIRKVDMLDADTYDTIRSFSSIKEAAKFVNLVGSNIQVAAKTGSISGGHRWKYSEQVDYKSKEKKTLAKKIKAYRIESPDQIIIFDSMREAFEYTGISKSAIHTRCNRKDNEYKGWCFEYVEKYFYFWHNFSIFVHSIKNKTMSTVLALHDKVILKKIDSEDQTVGGIIVPDMGAEKSNYFEVVSAGGGMYDPSSGGYYPMSVKVGDTVIVPKAVVTQILVDREEYYVCREVEILSIIRD